MRRRAPRTINRTVSQSGTGEKMHFNTFTWSLLSLFKSNGKETYGTRWAWFHDQSPPWCHRQHQCCRNRRRCPTTWPHWWPGQPLWTHTTLKFIIYCHTIYFDLDANWSDKQGYWILLYNIISSSWSSSSLVGVKQMFFLLLLTCDQFPLYPSKDLQNWMAHTNAILMDKSCHMLEENVAVLIVFFHRFTNVPTCMS